MTTAESTSCPTKPFCSDHLRFVMNREIKQCSNRAVVWKKLDFSLCSYAGADKKFDPSQKTRTFAKRLFLRHHPLMILYMYGLSRTQEDVGNINLTSVRLGWLTANGREIYWDLVSRNHSRLGRHHHQPHRNIGHQNHNWDYLLLALVTTILIIIFFNSIMLIFYDAFRNHDSDHLFSCGKTPLHTDSSLRSAVVAELQLTYGRSQPCGWSQPIVL